MEKASERVLEFQWGGVSYWGTSFEDNVGGCAGIELHRKMDGKEALVARLTYWDATSDYWLETVEADIQLRVLDKLIAATKSLVGEA